MPEEENEHLDRDIIIPSAVNENEIVQRVDVDVDVDMFSPINIKSGIDLRSKEEEGGVKGMKSEWKTEDRDRDKESEKTEKKRRKSKSMKSMRRGSRNDSNAKFTLTHTHIHTLEQEQTASAAASAYAYNEGEGREGSSTEESSEEEEDITAGGPKMVPFGAPQGQGGDMSTFFELFRDNLEEEEEEDSLASKCTSRSKSQV